MRAEFKGVSNMAGTARGSAAATGSENWYYMDGAKKQGPVDAAVLVSKLTAGELPPNTRVWKKGMEGWRAADETDLLNRTADQKQTSAESVQYKAQKPETKRKKRWWIWLILGILVAIIIGAVLSVMVFRRKAPAEAEQQATEVQEVLTYGLKDSVIFEDDQCAFLIDAVGEKGDYLELDVRCVNKTSDTLSFTWKSTRINGSMFDPLWSVCVQGNATLRSSITFPLTKLKNHNLLPGEEINFVLSVFNEDRFAEILEESQKYIARNVNSAGKDHFGGCKEIKGFDGWFFSWRTRIDKKGRPYILLSDKSSIYFDEIRDSSGDLLYKSDTTEPWNGKFYDDSFGRPYYFSKRGSTVYYDGYGYAFYDKEADRNYYYDVNGQIAYYGNNGVPEYYDGTVSQEQLDAGKPEKLEHADGCFVVHKEFTIYPTGKDAGQITYPERVSADTEKVYWDGEKGQFILLGGTRDVKGYTVRTYVENNTDDYFYFCWKDVTVNGVAVDDTVLDSSMPIRPHSCYYKDILIPVSVLKQVEEQLGSDELAEIGFTLKAGGENLKVHLYPIIWEVPPASEND